MVNGPDYTQGLIEPPRGEKKMNGYVLAVYDKEQQERLGVDMYGKKEETTFKPRGINIWSEILFGIIFYCLFFLLSGLIIKYDQNYNITGNTILILGAVLTFVLIIVSYIIKLPLLKSFFKLIFVY